MRAQISVHRPFHAALLANALLRCGAKTEIYSSALRRYFRGLSGEAVLHLVPSPLAIFGRLTRVRIPTQMAFVDNALFDLGVAAVLPSSDIFIGWASQCLYSARKATRRGIPFVLDRACPHCDFQQALVERESELVGAAWRPQPAWFRERQLEEYEMADAILVPSRYTAQSFPKHLQAKLVKAPLFGRCSFPETVRMERNHCFTVGVVGGSPLRKGYLYLLRAWKKLGLPNARLLLRTGRTLDAYPALHQLAKELPNLDIVDYVPNLSEFYQRCDAFVLPSIDDGFGMALIEAMVNGRACIATTNCGASELMTDGRDGLIIAPADEDALAAALLRLYNAEELRQSLGVAARRRASQILEAGLYYSAIAHLLDGISGNGIAAPQTPSGAAVAAQ